MVREPVEHGGGHLGVAEDLRPIGEGQVGGDERKPRSFRRFWHSEATQKYFPSLLFNLGNARLRQAFGLITNEDLSGAIPFVNLAKRDFRRVLELEPDNWNPKYNLDVGMRLVRDYPLGQENEGDTLPASKQLWPDMPGIPEGLAMKLTVFTGSMVRNVRFCLTLAAMITAGIAIVLPPFNASRERSIFCPCSI